MALGKSKETLVVGYEACQGLVFIVYTFVVPGSLSFSCTFSFSIGSTSMYDTLVEH